MLGKQPVPGACKTRLVPPLSLAGAASLQAAFLEDLAAMALAQSAATAYLAYAPASDEARTHFLGQWPAERLFAQRPGDLGDRLEAAGEHLFAAGHAPVLVVGADLPTLQPAAIAEAIAALASAEVVLGPASDGGYWLVGLNAPCPALWRGIPWSTPDALGTTLAAARGCGRSVALLGVETDVDTSEDLLALARRLAAPPADWTNFPHASAGRFGTCSRVSTEETHPMANLADIGVFGGSGFYRLLPTFEEHAIETPYGPPSARIAVGEVAGRRVAFMPRHGHDHALPPHRINYRANLWAMKSLGVTRLFAPCAAGSLKREVAPGDLVILDQLVDRTQGRADTFYDGPITTHIAFADPYCPHLRAIARTVAKRRDDRIHPAGTVVVIQGPRFSTRAESRWFAAQGWDTINMTQYPELALARELAMCACGIALVTDYDAGVEGLPDVAPVTSVEAMKVFYQHNDRLRDYVLALIASTPASRDACRCAEAITDARSV